MTDVNRLLLAAAVAGGYVLGRTKKGRLALTVASYVAGRQFGVEPRKLVTQGVKRIGEIPQVADLGDQMRGELMTAGREAVSAAADRRLSAFADSLHERTLRLEGSEEEQERAEENEKSLARENEEEEGEEGYEPEDREKTPRSDHTSKRKSEGHEEGPRKAGDRKRVAKPGKPAPSKNPPTGKPPARKKAGGTTAPRRKTPSATEKSSPRAEHQR